MSVRFEQATAGLTGFVLCYLKRCLLAAAFLCAALTAAQAADNDQVAAELKKFIDSGEPAIGNEDSDERIIEVYLFYAQDRDYKPVWVRDSGPKAKARQILDVFKDAANMGLDPTDYRIDEIEQRMTATDPKTLAELDLLLSRAFIDFGRDVSRGRIEPSAASAENAIVAKELGPLTLIGGAEYASSISDYVKTIEPQTPQYTLLKEALGRYREIAAKGGWPSIAKGPAIKPLGRDARIPVLRRLLLITGDLNADVPDRGDRYDADMVAAVKWFQYRHGLREDGVIAETTLNEMNVPVQRRIHQLEINLERRRWMDDDLGNYYIFVNIADQFLKVVKDGKTIHEAKLVVGKPNSRTPVFSETMKYIVINPYWQVPPSIANKEYLPKLKRDPGALRRERIRLFKGESEIDPYRVNWKGMRRIPYTLRQDSGPKNALGRLKFMFPNRFNVYIHDTPSKALFQKEVRIFSHGCMRVENPKALAALLLGAQGWTEAKIAAAIDSGKQRVINLKQPVPVHVTYLTAWVNKDRSVHFRRDVYGRDRQLDEALNELLLSGK